MISAGSTGADDYRANIAGCNSAVLDPGYTMTPEPGNMVGPTAQGMADRHRATHGSIGAGEKGEYQAVARRNSHQFVLRFSRAKLPRVADEPIQLLLPLTLLVGQQFGVTDNVDEEDMRDLQSEVALPLDISGHSRV